MKYSRIIKALANDISDQLEPNVYGNYGNDEQEPILLGRLIDLVFLAKLSKNESLIKQANKAHQDYFKDSTNKTLLDDLDIIANSATIKE